MRFPLHITTDAIKHQITNGLKGNKRYPMVLMLEPLYTCNLACLGCTCGTLGDTRSAHRYLKQGLALNCPILNRYSLVLSILGIAALFEQHEQAEAALELLAILLHHPQCGSSAAAIRMQILLARLQSKLPAGRVDEVMSQAKQGRLPGRYLDPQFAMTPQLIDQLLQLLDQIADG